MPLLFVIIGTALVVSAVLNNQAKLGQLLAADLPGFLPWAAAIILIGMIGFIPQARTLARSLLVLVLLVIVLANGNGLFDKVSSAIQSPTPAEPPTLPTLKGPLPIVITGAPKQGAAAGGNVLGSAVGGAVSSAVGGIFG